MSLNYNRSLNKAIGILLDQWGVRDHCFIFQTFSQFIRQLQMLLYKLIKFFISDFLFLHLILNIVIVLYHLLALFPKFLDKLIDKLSFAFQLQLLFSILLMLHHQFFLQLLLASSHKLFTQISFVLALPLKIIGHPLHFLDEEGPMGLLLETNFLSLDFSPDIITQLSKGRIQ